MTSDPLPPVQQDGYVWDQILFTPTRFGMDEADEDVEATGQRWQISPPIVTGGRISAVRPRTDPLPPTQETGHQEAYIRQPSRPLSSQQERTPLFRVSFFGPDQQWYSVKIGRDEGVAAPNVSQPLPAGREPTPPVRSMLRESGITTSGPVPPSAQNQSAAYEGMIQNQATAAQPALHPAWYGPTASGRPVKEPDVTTAGLVSTFARGQRFNASIASNVLLQMIKPRLVGLMNGSVLTLAPIFAVAFATHKPFTVFLVGMASALGVGIIMAFSEMFSDGGGLLGHDNLFVRGGITGLMIFLSGVGHALPFLIPNIQLALVLAYIVVAIELLTIAAIRHKFFGTSWRLSTIQFVGGGILVCVAAIVLGST